MPRGRVILLAEDPPYMREDQASKWTIRTLDGIVHIWGDRSMRAVECRTRVRLGPFTKSVSFSKVRMRNIVSMYLLSFAMVTAGCAQTSSHDQAGHTSDSGEGTVVCKNERAMVTLIRTRTPLLTLNVEVLDRLIERGDCLEMPRGWEMLEARDPPLNKQEVHASKVTIRTPHGIVHMWGMPFGGD